MQKSTVVYNTNGEGSFVDLIVKLTKEGHEVDIHATHRSGVSCYVVVWDEVEKEEEKDPLEIIEENKPTERLEGVPEVISNPQPDPDPFRTVKTPDFKYAAHFKNQFEKEADAKAALLKYAAEFGFKEEDFDKRKGFPKILQSFKGKWGQRVKQS